MARVTLVEVDARLVEDGSPATVLMAGGGVRPYIGHRGKTGWKALIADPPQFAWSIGFDQQGWAGTALPATTRLRLMSGTAGYVANIADSYLLNGAAVRLYDGDDRVLPAPFAALMTGKVSASSYADGALLLECSDVTETLNGPFLSARFGGSGGIDGDIDAAQRIKRRSLGRVFNVRGNLLDKANNIYEFGDPARPLQSFTLVKDIGRAGPLTVLAWQGTIAATFAALKAAAAPKGGGVVAPSIACVKWWTTPILLTADIEGEVGAGYVDNAPQIAERIIAGYAGLTTTNAADLAQARPAKAGLHVDSENESGASLLDRLLLPLFILWIPNEDGAVDLRVVSFDAPVVTIQAQDVARRSILKPTLSRRIGYQANNYVHSDGEISAALTYEDGTKIDDLKPATANADNTATTPTGTAVGNGLNQDGTVKDGKVDTPSIISGGVTGLSSYSFPDQAVGQSEVVLAEVTGLQIGDGVDGRALAFFSFTQDGSTVVDTSQRIMVYVDTGSGYMVVRDTVQGIAVQDGQGRWILSQSIPISIMASNAISLKLTAQGNSLAGGPRSGSFARNIQIDVLRASR